MFTPLSSTGLPSTCQTVAGNCCKLKCYVSPKKQILSHLIAVYINIMKSYQIVGY